MFKLVFNKIKMRWEFIKEMEWKKYGKPVLASGKPGEWDDYSCITPSIFQQGQESFFMFYTGQSFRSGDWGIGIAESKDLFLWEKRCKKSILNGLDNKISSRIDGISIIENQNFYVFFEAKYGSTDVLFNMKSLVPYKIKKYLVRLKRSIKNMIESSMAVTHAENRKICYVISESFFPLYIGSAKVALEKNKDGWDSRGVFSPRVFKFENIFYLLYGGSNGKCVNTGLAFSEDLLSWEKVKQNPILKHGAKGEWDQNHALMVDIIKIDDGYLGFFEGEDRHNNYSIGLAFSRDLVNWEKSENNPILRPGKNKSFDEKMVCSPHVIARNDKIYLFYSGHNYFMQGACGLAIGERKA